MRLLALFVLLPTFMHAQNLVPNPGFEAYRALPDKRISGVACIEGWRNPTSSGSGDYFHDLGLKGKFQTVNNHLGKEVAHGGEAFAGVCMGKKIWEFLQCQLTEPLQKGRTYRITIHISKGDKWWLGKVEDFGLIFHEKQMNIPNEPGLQAPQVYFHQSGGFTQKKGWQKLEANYIATGYEKFITLGSFQFITTNEDGNTVKSGGVKGGKLIRYAHYYVDDVSIVPVSAASNSLRPVE